MGRCHPSSEETLTKTVLLLRTASLGGYPQCCEDKEAVRVVRDLLRGSSHALPGDAGQNRGHVSDRQGTAGALPPCPRGKDGPAALLLFHLGDGEGGAGVSGGAIPGSVGARRGGAMPRRPAPGKGTHEWVINEINIISHSEAQHRSSAAGLELIRIVAINIDDRGGCAAPG